VNLTFDDLKGDRCRYVRARRSIADAPSADHDSSAPKCAVGEVCDVDESNGVAFVDFGTGAIAVTPDELAPA
jgi:hypothetical protein